MRPHKSQDGFAVLQFVFVKYVHQGAKLRGWEAPRSGALNPERIARCGNGMLVRQIFFVL